MVILRNFDVSRIYRDNLWQLWIYRSEILFELDRQCLYLETAVSEMLITVVVMVMGRNVGSFFISFIWFVYCRAIWWTDISSKNSLLLDKLIVTQSVKKCFTFFGTPMAHCHTHLSPSLILTWTIYWAKSIHCISSYTIFKICLNIISIFATW